MAEVTKHTMKQKLLRWGKRLLRIVLWGAGIYGAFCGIENWLANRAYAEHMEWLKSKNEPLSLQQLAPPAVPDDQNAAYIPALECFYVRDEATGKRKWAVLDLEKIPTNLPQTQQNELLAWQRVIRGLDVVWRIKKLPDGTMDFAGGLTRSRREYDRLADRKNHNLPDPFPPGSESPLQAYLSFLGQFDSQIQSLQSMQQRSGFDWPRPEEDAEVPYLCLSLQKVLKVHGFFALHRRDITASLADFRLQIRLASTPPAGVGLLGGMWKSSHWKCCLSSLEDLLGARLLQEQEWARLAAEFPRADVAGVLQQTLREHRIRWHARLHSATMWELASQGYSCPCGGSPTDVYFFGPSGWVKRNLIASNLLTQQRIEALDATGPPLLAKFRSISVPTESNPHEFLAARFEQYWTPPSSLLEIAESADALQLGAAGIALERFRLKTGDYPAQLSLLVPEFLPQLPRSYFNAMKPMFRKLPNGSFDLWFFGIDGDDDDARSEDNSGERHFEITDYDLTLSPGAPIP